MSSSALMRPTTPWGLGSAVFVGFALGMIAIAVGNAPPEWPVSNMDPDTYARDSLYVAFSVEHRSLRYDVTGSSEPQVETIIYSSDTLRLFAAVIIRIADQPVRDGASDPLYVALGVVGYRTAGGQPWKLYSHPGLVGGLPSVEAADLVLRRYFLRDMKTHELAIVGPNHSIEYRKLQFTVNDPRYWSGPVWEKDIRLPDRYMFEAALSGVLGGAPFAEVHPYDVEYPDWLLEQFDRAN